MASHVVVVDSSFRRHTVKTTPNTYLSDVLNEACSKFGVNADNFTLKHSGKQVDISRTLRLSGLSGGAKLDLVQSSRSPALVSVALQLPNPGEAVGSLARLTDRFPSNTTIWQILRRFESGVAGVQPNQRLHYNFTQRAAPQMIDSKGGPFAGSGRLVYEMPVITIMSRSLASFSDLQRTLGQLGFNGGSCLLRLSYSITDQPLEEALATISKYFAEVDETEKEIQSAALNTEESQALPGPSQTSQSSDGPTHTITQILSSPINEPPQIVQPDTGPRSAVSDAVASPRTPGTPKDEGPNNQHAFPLQPQTTPQSSTPNNNLSIFAPPSSSTPAAAMSSHFNETDYTPTVEHAQTHQARLAHESRNKKLLSDAELSAQDAERAAALSSVTSVDVRIRFPDQSQAQKSFGQEATVQHVYEFCRELMDLPNNEVIEVRSANKSGKMEVFGEHDNRCLIKQLGWRGGVLVTVVWGPNVGLDARRRPALKAEYRAQAQTMRVTPDPVAANDAGADNSSKKSWLGSRSKDNGSGKSGKSNSGEKEAKLMKMLGFNRR